MGPIYYPALPPSKWETESASQRGYALSLKWFVEDLQETNRTYLKNGSSINKRHSLAEHDQHVVLWRFHFDQSTNPQRPSQASAITTTQRSGATHEELMKEVGSSHSSKFEALEFQFVKF